MGMYKTIEITYFDLLEQADENESTIIDLIRLFAINPHAFLLMAE